MAAKNLRFGYVTVLGFTNCRGVCLLARFMSNTMLIVTDVLSWLQKS